MDAEALADRLVAELGDAVSPETTHGLVTATVAPGDWRRAAELVQGDPDLGCDWFDFLAGVDEEADGLAVVLHVISSSRGHHVQLRTLVPREGGSLPTLSDLWFGADWHERETAELFGIDFAGHPNLVKLLLTTLMLVLVVVLLYPGLSAAGELAGELPRRDRINMVVAPSVSTSLLLFATVLSTYKPWGRVRR